LDTWHIILLAIIQGLTEFLPISSSAHLILLPKLMGWQDQGLAVDVAMHIGSLMAVLWYFRTQLGTLLAAWWESLRSRRLTSESRLVWGILFGTIPISLIGLIMVLTHFDDYLRSPLIIAWATLIFAALLWWAEVVGKRERDEYSLNWRDLMLIGLAQALALIHGASRSGVTMTAGLLLGLQRKAAARFSFLLSIPAILLAGTMDAVMMIKHPPTIAWSDLLIGMGVSALVAYLCIKMFINLLDKIGMLPFVIYRFILGMVLLIWVV